MNKLLSKFWRFFPLLLVIVVALSIATQNIKLGYIYSGWDNIHAEFDFPRYVRQVFFGAWLEHQGLGAPAALGQPSEIARLPILFALITFLPNDLVRYAFIFASFTIGGIGTYLFISRAWLANRTDQLKNWLASFGALCYLLHPFTLQQFYISFELFMVQFAYLPFLLLSVYYLNQKITTKTLFLFVVLQVLIAPSGHTPTIFYLAAMVSVIYAFFLAMRTSFIKALGLSLMVALLTFACNAYWILPNFSYVINDSAYVQDSRENRIFGPESVWSIKDAGTITNMLKGTHYLFNWKDYNFATQKQELIFNEWQSHLDQPVVSLLLEFFGVLTIAGGILLIFDKQKGPQKWAVLIVYLVCFSFVWIDLLPTHYLIDWLFQSPTLLETFRNPFTKFSIIFSFVSILLTTYSIEFLIKQLQQRKLGMIKSKTLGLLIILLLMGGLIYTMLPSFEGHFLSEKLQIKYPKQYQQLFSYLQTRNRNLRVLELPQLSHAGWEYYDWQSLGVGNGYQGMGFYFFGFPQAFLNRDTDRWAESSDFFYHELKNALDTNDAAHFSRVLQKYNVDLVVVDETRMDPSVKRPYALDHQIVEKAGLRQVWQQDFLTVYERDSQHAEDEVIVPTTFSLVAADTDRVRNDEVFQNEGDYIPVASPSAPITYPFAQLRATEVQSVSYTDHSAEIHQTVPSGNYVLSLPATTDSPYFVPAAMTYKNQTVTITFPKNSIISGTQVINLPHLADMSFSVNTNPDFLIVFVDDAVVELEKGKTAYPILPLATDRQIVVDYAAKPAELPRTKSGALDVSQLNITPAVVVSPNWSTLNQPLSQPILVDSQITLRTVFPVESLDLQQNPSTNCDNPPLGTISTKAVDGKVIYEADKYGVNCNGYNFAYNAPTYPYLMNVTGKNLHGRGPKFFISYSDPSILPEDYLLPANIFNASFALEKVTSDPVSLFFLNWETRSFGKDSRVELDGITLTPFPLAQMSALKLTLPNTPAVIKNDISVTGDYSFNDFLHLIDFNCHQENCYIGIDQSFDKGWLAFKIGLPKALAHYRFDDWANLWQVQGEGELLVLYVPQLISLVALGGFVIGLSFLSFRFWKKYRHVAKPAKVRTNVHVKKVLLGKSRSPIK